MSKLKILTEAEDFEDHGEMNDEEQLVCTKAAGIIAKAAVAPSRGRKVDSKYDKYRQIMFGKEDDEEEEQDDLSFRPNKAPKASTQRTPWSEQEVSEINANYDYTTRGTRCKETN